MRAKIEILHTPYTNAHVNRTLAGHAYNAGMTTEQIASEWPLVWKLDSEGRLGQRYTHRVRCAHTGDILLETDAMITKESVKEAVKRYTGKTIRLR